MSLLQRLQSRLAYELGIKAEMLAERVRVYVSFLPESAPEPAKGDERHGQPGWSHGWCKPKPGMLFQAMADCEVGGEEVLAVGHDPRDKEAAAAAGVHYIQWQALFYDFNMNAHLVSPLQQLGVSAPESFVPGK